MRQFLPGENISSPPKLFPENVKEIYSQIDAQESPTALQGNTSKSPLGQQKALKYLR